MKVLSIDLDYCMDTCMNMVVNDTIRPLADDNPVVNWKLFDEFAPIPDKSIFIDDDNVEFCFDVFTKALEHCHDVVFAYDHDAILYRLEKSDAYNIDLINIDYHGDMLNGTPYTRYLHLFNNDEQQAFEYEFNTFKENKVMEGSWVGWLEWKNKLKKYTWIHGKSIERYNVIDDFYHDLFSADLNSSVREKYTFDDYKFDFIFVCLSPTYVPQKFWNIMTPYLSEYEKVTGNPYKLVNRKYEIDCRYREMHKYTLPRNK